MCFFIYVVRYLCCVYVVVSVLGRSLLYVCMCSLCVSSFFRSNVMYLFISLFRPLVISLFRSLFAFAIPFVIFFTPYIIYLFSLLMLLFVLAYFFMSFIMVLFASLVLELCHFVCINVCSPCFISPASYLLRS